VSWFRKPPPPRELPARVPHPDGQVEAELQRVMALQRQVARIETRLADIRDQRLVLEASAHARDNNGSWSEAQRLLAQSAALREERDALEAELAPLHDEISKRLADLGEDALLL
jgi:predicted  nucleic acid-binding Zn-ribbon protein